MSSEGKQKRELAAVILFVFNRPWHTRITVEALQKNEFAKDSDLVIFSDGPRAEKDVAKVAEVREYIRTIKGFRSLRIIERDQNFGLASSIIDGVTSSVTEFSRVIVLEDDLVTSSYFLRFMNDGLTMYENEQRVISIHGYVYPVADALPETFFLKGADCWGWGTWKRGWDLLEEDGSVLLSDLQRRRKTQEFDYNGSGGFVRMLEDQIARKNDSWAIRWYASAFLHEKLTLYPGRSLIMNIGTDGTGTHGKASYSYGNTVAQNRVPVRPIPIEESSIARNSFELFFREKRGSFFNRIVRKIKALLWS